MKPHETDLVAGAARTTACDVTWVTCFGSTNTHLEGTRLDFKVALLLTFLGTQSAARWRMAGDGNYGSTGKWTIKKASQYSVSNTTGSTNLFVID